ncbi:Adenylate cyclase [Phytophthora cinnamomi]|uniref:Adenylate cyclase n=1 Tax=Phytophthora cinnamomi TaxID=4785 RepID=UPI00355AA266|nr:Adenylate cyclase [Phytophthora cinnamomi]
MVWTTLAIAAMGLSCVATGITSYSLRRSWDLQISSVRWLFFVFFACYCMYGAARVAYMVAVSAKAKWGTTANDEYLADHYTTLGIFAPLHSRVSHDPLVTVFLVAGDSVHFSVATWMFPLIYELGFIARKTMDRGAEKEKEQIRWYLWCVWPVIGAFTVAETVLAAVKGGYTTSTQAFQLAVYFTMFASFLYMLFMVLRLKWDGRKYENVQGQFVTSPIYQRLSRILAIYALFTLQYQLASVISYAMPDDRDVLSNYTSISTVIYNISGLALAITTMCSQMCVLQMCRWCLPDDIEAQVEARLMQPGELLSPRDTQILVESAEPPLVNPVFVFTDIQQSSALWGVGDGLIMQRATEIHDNILRSALMKYRGYEITTAGDAFQLAFHTVREAVEYCMDVQLQLLEAPWPKELHNLLPATKKQRAGRHLIFCGLRVRMGIHDAVDADGTLVLDVHAVTGKMTYTGASEVIANEIGDLGDGGQILVTRRVADWLEMYADLVAIPCSVDRIGNYTVPQINTTVEVFQVIPTVLAKRKKNFTTTVATTLKRRPGHGNPATGANSFTRNDGTPPGMSSVAAERRRNLYALRERRRQLEQGALGRPASHQALMRSESSRPSFAFDTRPSYARTTSM